MATATLAFAVIAVAPGARAQVVYTVGLAPTVSTSSMIEDSFQSQAADLSAVVSNASVTQTVTTGSSVVTQTISDNTISAALDSNLSTLNLDIVNASGAAGVSNAVIASAQETVTAAGIYGAVTNGDIAQISAAPAAGSVVTLDGNTLAADVTLNQASNNLQGGLNAGFANTDTGTTGQVTLNAAAATNLFVAPQDAGLLVSSSQINRDVDSVIGATTNTAFSTVDGASSITSVVNGAYDPSISISADDNTISAAFGGNAVDNQLNVTAAGDPTLTSAAGVVSVQINDDVDPDTAAGANALIGSGAAISVLADDGAAGGTFSSTLSFERNTITAQATGSSADNDLLIASGVSVDTTGANLNTEQANTVDFTTAAQTVTTTAGLFVSNAQEIDDSSVISEIADAGTTADMSVTIAEALSGATVLADDNAIRTQTLGNTADSAIVVAGASTFTGTAAATNLQVVDNGAAETIGATTDTGILDVTLGTDPGTTTTGATVSTSGNDIESLAIANRDPLVVDITASGAISDGGRTAPMVASVDSSQQLVTVNAGVSALNAQAITGVAATTVSSQTTDAAILTDVGATTGAGSTITASTFQTGSNTLGSSATANQAGVLVSLEGGNAIDASTAAVSIQSAGDSDLVVDADTSGAIVTTLNSVQTDATLAGVTAVVGAGSIENRLTEGNRISSAAAGNANTSSLSVDAAGEMTVSSVIGATAADSLAMNDGIAGGAAAVGEMAVLSDQRLGSGNTIDANTTGQIGLNLRTSAVGTTTTVADTTLRVDGNFVTAAARGNTTENALTFDAASVDMSTAANGGAGSTNLASLGAAQDIGAGSAVNATIGANASGTGDIFVALGTTDPSTPGTSTATVTGTTLSADANTVNAFAAGNTATNRLTASGSSLDIDGAGAATIGLVDGGLPASPDLATSGVAISTGVLQTNAGDVTAVIAETNDFDIRVNLDTTGNSSANTQTATLSADSNMVLAQARGATATTTSALDYSDVAASASVAILQQQSDSVVASIGADRTGVAGTGGATISVIADDSNTADLVGSTLTASANTLGVSAIGASSGQATANNVTFEPTLSVSADNSLAPGASTSAGSAVIDYGSTQDTVDFVSANFGVATRQTFSSGGSITGTANDLTVEIDAANVAGVSLAADGNLLTASATGGEVRSGLDLEGGSIDANVTGSVLTDQRMTDGASVRASTLSSDVGVTVQAMDATAGGTNGTDTVSVDGNVISAVGLGLRGTNTLAAESAGGFAGAVATPTVTFDADGASTVTSDMTLFSSQVSASGSPVSATVSTAAVSVAQQAGAILGDTLTIDGNTVLAQGTGATATNALSTVSGAALDGTASLLSNQSRSDGAEVTVVNGGAGLAGTDITMTTASTVDGATLSISGNDVFATGAGVSAVNTLTATAAAGMTGDGAAGGTVTTVGLTDSTVAADRNLVSVQSLSGGAALNVDVTNPTVSLTTAGAIGGTTASTVAIDGNEIEATATLASAANSLTATAGGDLGSYSAVANVQNITGGASTEATVTSASIDLNNAAGQNLTGTASVNDNDLAAVATSGTATNTLTLSGASITGAGAASALDLDNTTATPVLVFEGADDPLGAVANLQRRSSPFVTANLETSVDGGLLIDASFGTITGTASVDGNELTAQARGLEATNRLTATSDNGVTGSMAVGSVQIGGTGAITAGVADAGDSSAQIRLDATGAINGTVSVDDNVVRAAGLSNLATNALSVSAGNGVTAGTEVVGTVDPLAGGGGLTAATAGFSVMNDQASATAVTGEVRDFTAVLDAGATIGGTATVDGNMVMTDARSNYGVNSLSLDATGALAASGTVMNQQATTADADIVSRINQAGDDGLIGLDATGAVTGSASVSGNVLQANATQNQAINGMAISGATLQTAGGGSIAAGPVGTSDFVALNAQSNLGDASSEINAFTIGMIDAGGTAGLEAGLSGTAAVNGNMVMAMAGGNLASNTFTIDAAGNARGDFAFGGVQSNTGAITAQVASVTIGLNSAASSAGTFSLDGNRIGATAQGNVSSTTLGRTGSSFSNF